MRLVKSVQETSHDLFSKNPKNYIFRQETVTTKYSESTSVNSQLLSYKNILLEEDVEEKPQQECTIPRQSCSFVEDREEYNDESTVTGGFEENFVDLECITVESSLESEIDSLSYSDSSFIQSNSYKSNKRSGLFLALKEGEEEGLCTHNEKKNQLQKRNAHSAPDLRHCSTSSLILDQQDMCLDPGEFRKCRHCKSIFPCIRPNFNNESLRFSFCSGECHLTYVTLYHLAAKRKRSALNTNTLS